MIDSSDLKDGMKDALGEAYRAAPELALPHRDARACNEHRALCLVETHFVPTLQRLRCAYFASLLGLETGVAAVEAYVLFQLQNLAFVVGHEPGAAPGTGCPANPSADVVEVGHSTVNLTSDMLYLGAIRSAVSDAPVLLASGVGDRMRHALSAGVVQHPAHCSRHVLHPIRGSALQSVKDFNHLCGALGRLQRLNFACDSLVQHLCPVCDASSPDIPVSLCRSN